MSRFSLHFPAGTIEPISDDNVDVQVELVDGRVFALTFFTLKNLETLMARWGRTGECANGLYVWAKNMIVVQELSHTVIEEVCRDLVESGDVGAIGWPIRSEH